MEVVGIFDKISFYVVIGMKLYGNVCGGIDFRYYLFLLFLEKVMS